MSLKVMNWAWSIALPPAPKLVLMALADEANDDAFCFPSIAHLAVKCTLNERTVQRVLRKLVADHYVTIEDRFRRDRARTSNGYGMAIGHLLTNCHRPPDGGDTGPVITVPGARWRRCHREGGDVAGVTTTYSSIKPPPQEPKGPDHTHKGDGARSCVDRLLSFPTGISTTQRNALAMHVSGLSPDNAQQILDELAGRMKVTRVRDPVRYCVRLVERFRHGAFDLELGHAIAKRREHERGEEPRPAARAPANRLSTECVVEHLPPRVRDARNESVVRRIHANATPIQMRIERPRRFIDVSTARVWT